MSCDARQSAKVHYFCKLSDSCPIAVQVTCTFDLRIFVRDVLRTGAINFAVVAVHTQTFISQSGLYTTSVVTDVRRRCFRGGHSIYLGRIRWAALGTLGNCCSPGYARAERFITASYRFAIFRGLCTYPFARKQVHASGTSK